MKKWLLPAAIVLVAVLAYVFFINNAAPGGPESPRDQNNQVTTVESGECENCHTDSARIDQIVGELEAQQETPQSSGG